VTDEKPKSKRGGARKGAGAKKKLPPAAVEAKLDGRTVVGRSVAGTVLEKAHAGELWHSMLLIECERLGIDPATGKLIPQIRDKDGKLVSGPETRGNVGQMYTVLHYLEDRHLGRAVDTVNHIHKDPIQVNARLSLGEGMRLAMEKADERVANRKRS
jgi:hypothetical protein